MSVRIARLVIAGLSGDSGKTIVSMSLLAAFRRKRRVLSAFKKGPDYIDSAWLGRAAGTLCRNLDTYLVDAADVRRTFAIHAAKSDFTLIEGNRGLFDGKDVTGTHSTAELAKLLQAPVVLVVNATKTTRTLAAVINGCLAFDREVPIVGVIVNKVGGRRHGRIVTDTIERYCQLPVLGVIPRVNDNAPLIPSRHLGLVPPAEFDDGAQLDERLAVLAEKHLDIEGILKAASQAVPVDVPRRQRAATRQAAIKVGYFKDSVFTFYYPENLEALQDAEADLIPVDSLADSRLPDVDALYIGGGFPETHAEQLADNSPMLTSVKQAAEKGLPIYAECGGLIFLSRTLTVKDSIYPMAGVFDVDLRLDSKPVGHGYTLLRVDHPNPFFDVGVAIKGHEFHYSGVLQLPSDVTTCMKVETGVGLGGQRDGLVYKQAMASYTHIHALGVPPWAERLVARAGEYRLNRQKAANDSVAGPVGGKDSDHPILRKAGERVALEPQPVGLAGG